MYGAYLLWSYHMAGLDFRFKTSSQAWRNMHMRFRSCGWVCVCLCVCVCVSLWFMGICTCMYTADICTCGLGLLGRYVCVCVCVRVCVCVCVSSWFMGICTYMYTADMRFRSRGYACAYVNVFSWFMRMCTCMYTGDFDSRLHPKPAEICICMRTLQTRFNAVGITQIVDAYTRIHLCECMQMYLYAYIHV
jgi:hypothetical protein